MHNRHRGSLALGLIGAAMMLLALLDPLEGFPLVLAGGALELLAARLAASRWFRFLAWGLGMAAAGCAAMLVLTALGGVRPASGTPPTWILIVAPYPLGGAFLLAGSILLILDLLRMGRSRGAPLTK